MAGTVDCVPMPDLSCHCIRPEAHPKHLSLRPGAYLRLPQSGNSGLVVESGGGGRTRREIVRGQTPSDCFPGGIFCFPSTNEEQISR